MKLLRKLGLYASIVGYSWRHNKDFASENAIFFSRLGKELARHDVDLAGRRVLDVGCGKSHWLTLLLHSAGAETCGIDTEYARAGRGPAKYLGILRQNGLDRMLRTVVWDWTFGVAYYRELRRQSSFPLRFRGLDVRCMDITRTEFPDHSFDLVVSHEVFEHVPDLKVAARELRRILRPGGFTYIYFHNYASVSGGHSIAWKYPDSEPSERVPAWDHLRRNLFPDIPSWINRKRVMEYRAAFEESFDIIDWIALSKEGEALLTPEIRQELVDYSQEELLTKGYVIIARPKGSNGVTAAESTEL
jgi:SAM-dependent methyltransferase